MQALGEIRGDIRGINARLDRLNGSVAELKQKEYQRSIREARAEGYSAGLSQAVLTRRQLAALTTGVGGIAAVVQVVFRFL